MGFSGKHLFGEQNEMRVTFVEKKVSKTRADFLKELLEYNGYVVLVGEDKRKSEEDPQTYTVAVTDMTFNPTIAVFQRKLKTRDGRMVTPDYWKQLTNDTNPQYWESR